MDPLSDVLSILKPRSYVSSGFDAGGDWAIQFNDQQGRLKCYAVIKGSAWIQVDGDANPTRVAAGDCFVLPSGRPFRMGSNLAIAAVNANSVFPPARAGGVVTHNGGGDFYFVGARFAVGTHHARALLYTLPSIIHIHGDQARTSLRWCVEQMMNELREGQAGSQLVAQHLAHIMLVQALRLNLKQPTLLGVGWYYALADEQIGAVLAAIHDTPSKDWSVGGLAKIAGTSRSTFAARFKERVGTAPLEYVTRWRMLLAGDRLTTSQETIASIGFSLGYESESAFTVAFRRIMGTTPSDYAREQRNPVAYESSDRLTNAASE
jgi:AraC-like DNA-binding protein